MRSRKSIKWKNNKSKLRFSNSYSNNKPKEIYKCKYHKYKNKNKITCIKAKLTPLIKKCFNRSIICQLGNRFLNSRKDLVKFNIKTKFC